MTIAEVAKLAGVSRAAVSRYFNHGYISEEKREAIRKVVEETGYHPSLQAQTLRTKKTKMVGVIVPKIASSSVSKVVEGVLSILNENGYQMLLAVTQDDPEKELEYLNAFDNKQVDGIILIATVFSPEYKKRLKTLQVPIVIVGRLLNGYACVFHDDYHATYDLTNYFIENGRTKLGYIGVTQKDKAAGEARYRGFMDAVHEKEDLNCVGSSVTAEFSMQSGFEKADELLKMCPDLDGIICATDTIAAGAMQYLQKQHIDVPGQIAVAGHGDSDIARATAPAMLTVHYHYETSGEIAVRMLMDIIADQRDVPREIKLGYHLITYK